MSDKKTASVNFKIAYSQTMRRIFFNRFTFARSDDLMHVHVWYQDEFKRDSEQYAFIFTEEDFDLCRKNMKLYLQKVMKDSNKKGLPDYCAEQYPASAHPIVDNVRTIMCSRAGSRAEIYFGFLPLAMTIPSTPEEAKWEDIKLNIALCSTLDCHISLLRKMIEK